MGAAAFAAGLLAAACLLGGMVFFAAVVAPLVFTRLDAASSGPFIRATFPRYYLYVLATSALAAVLLAARDPASASVLALVAAATLWLWQGLMPRINALRDAELGGDAAAAPRFTRLHRLSVGVNLVQLLAAAGVLVRLATR